MKTDSVFKNVVFVKKLIILNQKKEILKGICKTYTENTLNSEKKAWLCFYEL